ncbi:MAG: hypothetical protein R3C29_00090 [Dehalococcoidia bacterium]|nr:hypothetical protein [Dehalococcoidia bacterium]MCA9826098.1 hypothetical protein [Dehalococcoidia bacterium]MCA9843960.1 hypothetical protein [Dehalococcoidia bacterium]
MQPLVSAVSSPLATDPLRDPAASIAERRARQAQIATLRANLKVQTEAERSLDPNIGNRIDRAF